MSLTPEALRDIALGKGGSYGLSRDVLKHNLWDTRFFGTTIADYAFFTQPINSPWRAGTLKTKNETNMLDTGKLPNGQTFLVKRLGIALIAPLGAVSVLGAGTVQAFTDIIQSSVFELRIAGREFDFQVHGRQFLPGIMVSTNTAAFQSRVGDIVASAWISLDYIPIFIGPLVTFSVQHILNNPDPAVVTILNADATVLAGEYCSMQFTLEGVLTRAK